MCSKLLYTCYMSPKKTDSINAWSGNMWDILPDVLPLPVRCEASKRIHQTRWSSRWHDDQNQGHHRCNHNPLNKETHIRFCKLGPKRAIQKIEMEFDHPPSLAFPEPSREDGRYLPQRGQWFVGLSALCAKLQPNPGARRCLAGWAGFGAHCKQWMWMWGQ